jgi:putative flippase GtrA
VKRLARFLAVGAFNNALTYCIYLLALLAMPYSFAFTLSFAIGIGVGYATNALLVFGQQELRVGKASQYLIGYGVQYLLSLGLLHVAVRKLGIPAGLAPLAVLLVTVPFSFAWQRWVFRTSPR